MLKLLEKEMFNRIRIRKYEVTRPNRLVACTIQRGSKVVYKIETSTRKDFHFRQDVDAEYFIVRASSCKSRSDVESLLSIADDLFSFCCSGS